VSTGTESVLFNALPLLVLASLYLAVTIAVGPAVWRQRRSSDPLDYAVLTVFPAVGIAASVFAVLVLQERRPLGGEVWSAFVAIVVVAIPALVFILHWRDRGLVVGGVRRVRDAEERVSLRDRELEAVAAISNALARARDAEAAARPLVRQVRELLGVDFAGVVVVDDERETASGVFGELGDGEVGWWRDLRLDLRGEPSGIASAVFDAAVVVAYDVLSSPRISPRIAERLGAKSGVWVPMIAEERVIGVLVAAETRRQRALSPEETALLQALAAEAALALDRIRSADALSEALAENRRRLEQQEALLGAAQVVTSELELELVLQRFVEEVTKLLRADAADCYLLDASRGVLRCAAVHGLDPSLVGFEFAPEESMLALAPRREPRAGARFERLEDHVPHPAYDGLTRTIVVPMVWAGDTRGLLGVGVRDEGHMFDDADVELLEAFASLAALALRNAESFAERTQQARVQQAFFRIAELLGEPLSLTEALDAAAHAAVEALGGDHGIVVTPERGAPLQIVGAYRLPGEARELELPAALVDAAADGTIVASRRVSEDGRLDEAWRRSPFASVLTIPIECDPAVLVLVLFEGERAFVDEDLELARGIASAARGAIERSRLFEAERTARSLSQQLARTGSLLATELDPAAVLEEVVAQATALLGVDAGALAQLEAGELVIVAAVGEGAEDALGARSPSTGWLGGDVVQSRAPVSYADVTTDPALADADAVLASGFRAYLGVPLTAREGALHGVLTVYQRDARPWREEEIEALSALAANASIALSNAELYQRVALEREQSVAILANVADGIVAVDRDGHVVVWNAAAEQITGVPAGEAEGRTPYQVLQRNLEGDSVGGGANRLVSIMRGNEEVWLSLSEAVMRDPAGAVAGRIFAFRDISAERVVEQMKSDFVSTVSLELRTPLTSIYGFAQTLRREDIEFGEAERRTFLTYIATESERLTRIVDALLNVARLDTGDLQVSIEPTDVLAVLEDTVATIAGAGANGHEFIVDAEGELRAKADPDKLRQVLDQLVDNAVKYSPDGGLVRVEARRLPDAVEITVADEGAGIPQSQRERIFSKFYRGGDGSPAAGTGLGLFIAKGLVAAMGGRIWVDSEEGRGSRFTFELPAAGGE
jgi:PAS domain S-box-containing protein